MPSRKKITQSRGIHKKTPEGNRSKNITEAEPANAATNRLRARPARRTQWAQRPPARQQPAQPQQNQPRLAQTHAPQNFPRLVARIFAQRLLRRIIQQIHQLAVIILLKIVQRTPQQQMQIQLPPQFRSTLLDPPFSIASATPSAPRNPVTIPPTVVTFTCAAASPTR